MKTTYPQFFATAIVASLVACIVTLCTLQFDVVHRHQNTYNVSNYRNVFVQPTQSHYDSQDEYEARNPQDELLLAGFKMSKRQTTALPQNPPPPENGGRGGIVLRLPDGGSLWISYQPPRAPEIPKENKERDILQGHVNPTGIFKM